MTKTHFLLSIMARAARHWQLMLTMGLISAAVVLVVVVWARHTVATLLRRVVRHWRLVVAMAAIVIAAVPAVVAWANHAVTAAARGLTYTALATVPVRDTAVVLGCSRLARRDRLNGFFINRLDAATTLYKAGKVRHIIVSGDNHVVTYDEATDMRNDLIGRGVPASAVYCDYAGFSTLDTIMRARAVFGQTNIIVVSQRFQNERAIYIAQHRGVDAIGFNAADVPTTAASTRVKLREYAARLKAMLDVHVFNTQPKFFGPRILLADAEPAVIPPMPTQTQEQ